MTLLNALGKAVASELLPLLSRTANDVSAAFDMQGAEGLAKFILVCGAPTAGTNPTLDLKLTECDTSGGSYTDVTGGALTQVTSEAKVYSLALDVKSLKRYVKASWTLGGTATPTYSFGVVAEKMPKYS